MNKERITISISKNLLKQIDAKIDGIRIRNRSHAIENLSLEALGLDLLTDAIIMAGGENADKSLNAIKDSLIRLKSIGLKDVIIAIGFKGNRIKNELGNGDKFGISLNYLERGEGSGGAIKEIAKALKKTFMVINVDCVLDIDYKMLIEFHKSTLANVTVATKDIKTLKGVYIIEPSVIERIPRGFSMIEEDIFPKLQNEGKLTIYPIID